MKLNLKKISTVLAIASTLTATPALAEGKYTFDKYVGDVYVGKVNVWHSTSGKTVAEAYMGMPGCPADYSLQGYVKLKYKSPKGGYFTDTINPKEDDKGWYQFSNSGGEIATKGGRVYITDNTTCVFSGNQSRENVNKTLKHWGGVLGF